MASSKGLMPVESYIEARRRDGFSCEEIMKALNKKGYSEEVIALADKTYHYRLMIKVLGVVAGVAILVSLVLGAMAASRNGGAASPFPFSSSLSLSSLPSSSPEQKKMEDIQGCQLQTDLSVRQQCIASAVGELQTFIQKPMNPSDPNYAFYMQAVLLVASAQNNPAVCDRLNPSEQSFCKAGIPFLHAQLSGNPEDCMAIQTRTMQRGCIMDVLSSQNPAKWQEFQEQLAIESAKAIEKEDPLLCDALSMKFSQDDCKDKLKVYNAIKTGSSGQCKGVLDEDQRLYCLNAVLHKFEENR